MMAVLALSVSSRGLVQGGKEAKASSRGKHVSLTSTTNTAINSSTTRLYTHAMASLPASQRRHSPPQRDSSEQSAPGIQRADSEAQSTISEDSETVLLNPSSLRNTKDEQKESETPKAAPQQELEPRRCWICFTDETEDTPTSSEWRSPCPCALTAHESCLLDWIADMEAPNSRSRRSPRDKILCPQCKSEIVLARPRSYIVEAVRGMEISASKMVLPGVLLAGLGSFWSICWTHGLHSVLVVFGHEDAEHILAPLFMEVPAENTPWATIWNQIKARARLDIGLFLIPGALVFSRFTIADGVLPILPILFFVTVPDSEPFADLRTWPPSAGLSFALLPYMRSLYNTYYDRVWAAREKRWLKEIQPRATTEGQDETEQARQALNEEDNVLEINVDLGMLDEWDGEMAEQQDDRAEENQAHPLHAPPLDDIGGLPLQPGVPAVAPIEGAGAQAAPPQPDARPPPPAEGRGNFNLAVSTNRLAESVLGALAFPAISAVMGEFLRVALPKSLTARVAGPGGKATGLLQAKWGRSIVGGCMFVVLKDAVMLYVRWRMARDHRMRKVLDYDRRKPGKSVPPGGSR
jgi:hypothetical protein